MIIAAGKEKWVRARDYKVVLKGKGELPTYWLSVGSSSEEGRSEAGSSNHTSDDAPEMPDSGLVNVLSDEKIRRLVDWNVDVLQRALVDIMARRRAMGKRVSNPNVSERAFHSADQTPIDEVCEVIEMPRFEACSLAKTSKQADDGIQLSKQVVEQLESYVGAIAAMYNDNPFRTC